MSCIDQQHITNRNKSTYLSPQWARGLLMKGKALLVLSLALPLFATPLQANISELLGDSLTPATNQQPHFLPVAEAFVITGRFDDHHAYVDIKVAPGYYLYQERFVFFTTGSITHLGQPHYPEAQYRFDHHVKRTVAVFSEDGTIRLPAQAVGTVPELTLRFQGCAIAGLCYPPETITIPLVGQATTANAPAPVAELPASTAPLAKERYYQNILTQSGLIMTLLLFLLAGIGLSFTPCVLPMLPILSSLILGNQDHHRTRVLALTVAYILSLSATFAGAGALMGLFGAGLNLQAKLQSPWLLVPLASLFVLLALSLFGWYTLQLPAALRDRLGIIPKNQGNLSSAVLLGILSALVVSPCLSPPMMGALLYISTTADAVLGGLSLFALGLGIGIPLFIVSLGGRHWLPKAGAWMDSVRHIFGVLLLGVAIWLLARVVPGSVTLALWGSLAIGSAVFLGALTTQKPAGYAAVQQVLGIILLVYGVSLLIGALRGHQDPLQPLMSPALSPIANTTIDGYEQRAALHTIATQQALDAVLQQAAAQQQPVLVDVSADWCSACKNMERTLFPAPALKPLLAQVRLIKFDITEHTPAHQAFLNQQQLFGPPALLFFDGRGHQQDHLTLRGEPTIALLKQRLEALLF